MKTTSKIILYVFSVIALSWFLPWIYSLVIPKTGSEPFAAYSPVSNDWVLTIAGEDRKTDIYDIDADGNRKTFYTKNQRDSLLPQLYYKDLMARNRLSDTIAGKEVSVPTLRHAEMAFVSNPRDINKRQPEVYMMMESMPERVDLEDPTEVFRMDGKMEFVEMATNRVNVSRSQRFTETLVERGFVFPMKDFNADVTTRKLRDEGYLMVDAEGKVFHVKQRAGRPYVAKIAFPDSVKAKKVFIFEFMYERLIGMAIDTDDNIYFIERDGYRPVRLDVGKVDPSKERINVMGNMFNYVVRFASDTSTRWAALDADDFSLLGTYEFVYPVSSITRVRGYIFPYVLSFNSLKDSYACPRVSAVSFNAIFLNLILALLLFVVRRRRQPGVETGILSLLTIVFGIYLFIPAIIIKE